MPAIADVDHDDEVVVLFLRARHLERRAEELMIGMICRAAR